MKYQIITFGCQMNKSDSERIASLLEAIGYQVASKENEADLIVINITNQNSKLS
jgi:tRNA-2-methylthio-N6-dimethylallyladenosine synthase